MLLAQRIEDILVVKCKQGTRGFSSLLFVGTRTGKNLSLSLFPRPSPASTALPREERRMGKGTGRTKATEVLVLND